MSGTHHVTFSVGFALQTLGFRIINSVVWEKPDPPPNAFHTAFTHPKAVAGTALAGFSRRLAMRGLLNEFPQLGFHEGPG